MGTAVSLTTASPEPETGTPLERAQQILEQRPLRMAPMLRLCRIFNDASPLERLDFYHEGILETICLMIRAFSPNPPTQQNTQRKSTGQSKLRRKASASLPNMRAGVGFGCGTTKSRWDMEKTVEYRLAQEENLVSLLNVLSAYLYTASPDFSDPQTVLAKAEEKRSDHLTEDICVMIASTSGLISLIDYHLRNDSVFDVSQHMDLYQALLEMTCSMALCPFLLSSLVIPEKQEGRSIVKYLVPKFQETLDIYLESPKGQVTSPDFRLIQFIHKVQQWAEFLQVAGRKLTVRRSSSFQATTTTPTVSSPHETPTGSKSLTLPHSGVDVKGADVEERVTLSKCPHQSDQKSAISLSIDREGAYIKALKPLQVTTWKFIGDYGKLVGAYSFKKEAKNLNPFSPALKDRTKRIVKELASLNTSLPISYSNSIFVCVDESRCDIMKVLIMGPEDTPYQNGAFEFDIFFPSSYPYSPPKVSFLTTGNNSVRFNPNLYADGKVCLSILGTWEGRPEEKWNPYCSLLQILVSIQGLIFVKDPYFNEPGFERHMGTAKGKEYSRKYNLQIEHATLHYAIRGQLRDPPPHFAKRGQILDQAKRWKREVGEEVGGQKTSVTADSELFEINLSTLKTMMKTVDYLTDQLLILQPPPTTGT